MNDERQRKIDAMAVIMGGEGFHYVKEEIQGIVDGFHLGYRNAETREERIRCMEDAFRIERFWKQVQLKLADINTRATKPEETQNEIPGRDGRFER